MIKSLLSQWQSQKDQHSAILCSVVDRKGSVPRKDYPLMLVLDDGTLLGTIGGGSMEMKVCQAAQNMFTSPGANLLEFDMTGKDVDGDVGLCGGTLKVLIEPFSQSLLAFYEEMLTQSLQNHQLMIKIHISQYPSIQIKRELVNSKDGINHPDSSIENRLKEIFVNQQSGTFEHAGSLYHLWQVFYPPTLHIFGAGHVGQAVAHLAQFNELPVKVYDDRTELITSERFPYAERVVTQFPINREALKDIPESDFILIASREHKHDRELLGHALVMSVGYIGLVSSERKWKLLSENLHSRGFSLEALASVHAPVGLDIDAQTVPEIAISILSEIISVYRGRSA